MSTAKCIGRVGALALALGVGLSVAAAPVSTVSSAVKLSADSTALIMGGTSGPTPDETYIEIVKNQYITPTHPGQDFDYVAVTTPEELWPFTGAARLIGFAFGDPRFFGPGGPAWPDEPWWKLSGLFDLTADQSVQAGAADLEAAMARYGNDHLVIYGLSQGAGVANVEKKRLAAQYPAGTTAPDIDFVLSSDPNLPNGGLLSRFPGLYIPILDFTFNGPAATDTQFDTVEINRQYDGFSDFPLYPLNLIADLNAVLGVAYLHTNSFDVSLAPDASTSPAFQGTYGDTSYYFFETENLPLFAPLRQLGVPEPVINVVEPFFRVIVELGYDRSIPPWEPTPARLIPPLDPAKVITDLVDAVGEGVNNAAALFGAPAPLSIPTPATLVAPATDTARTGISPQVTASRTPTQTQQVTIDGDGDPNPAVDVGVPAPPSIPAPVTLVAPATQTAKADMSTQVTASRTPTQTQRVTSTDTPTPTQQVSSAPAGASDSPTTTTPEPSAGASTPKPAKPAGQLARPRPVVNHSLGVGRQLPGRSHRGEGGHLTTRTAAAGAEDTTPGHTSAASSPGDSSSKGHNSKGRNSSGDSAGDAGDE